MTVWDQIVINVLMWELIILAKLEQQTNVQSWEQILVPVVQKIIVGVLELLINAIPQVVRDSIIVAVVVE